MRRSIMSMLSAATKSKYPFLAELGIEDVNAGCYDGKSWSASGAIVEAISPITNTPIGPKVQLATPADTQRCLENMQSVKRQWMLVPAPRRGEIVRQIGEELRRYVNPLGELLALEVGKIYDEGKGEVQEFVDICDFATGLSRQLPGQVLPSERPGHFMMEQWHPLGAIGIIAAFNFPVAVPGWNTSISMIAGNTQIWKCAPTTNLCAIATQKIITKVLEKNGLPGSIATFVTGGADVGEAIVDSPTLPLVSFTGSTNVGRVINERCARRFGRALLELGGNNAIIVMNDADVEMAIRSILFGAVGTAGQRCTTCRRLYVHESIYECFTARLAKLYGGLAIGSPLEKGVLVGPLHTLTAVAAYKKAIEDAVKEGGKILFGGNVCEEGKPAPAGSKTGGAAGVIPGPNYVQPTIIEIDNPATAHCVRDEVFVPILYVMKFSQLEEAIEYNNNVSQGLSSAVFTLNMRHALTFTSAVGSDCGIVNVNCPTNGAEIGGAFGGEKATGGGRESGSDAWKQYCRRATTTMNFSTSMPLAQGVDFNVHE